MQTCSSANRTDTASVYLNLGQPDLVDLTDKLVLVEKLQ